MKNIKNIIFLIIIIIISIITACFGIYNKIKTVNAEIKKSINAKTYEK